MEREALGPSQARSGGSPGHVHALKSPAAREERGSTPGQHRETQTRKLMNFQVGILSYYYVSTIHSAMVSSL